MLQAVEELFSHAVATPYLPFGAGVGVGAAGVGLGSVASIGQAGPGPGLAHQGQGLVHQGQGLAHQGQGLVMVIPEGTFRPTKWPLAKLPAKKEPVCFTSARAFLAGKSLQTIALEHKGGCKGGTIVAHMLDALTHGMPVDLVTHPCIIHPSITHPIITHPSVTHPSVTHPLI